MQVMTTAATVMAVIIMGITITVKHLARRAFLGVVRHWRPC
jgi:hypothetical protein